MSPEDLKVSELDYKDKQLIKKLEKEFEEKMKKREREKKVESEKLNIVPQPKPVELKQPIKQPKEVVHDTSVEKKESKPDKPQPVAKKFQPKIQTVSIIQAFSKLSNEYDEKMI